VETRTRLQKHFLDLFGHPCTGIARAPGRVNLLGEHVDYNAGFVLPAATDRATYVAFSPTDSGLSTLWAEAYRQESRFSSQSIKTTQGLDAQPLAEWAKYPAGVAWALGERGLEVRGLEAVYASDVPIGAGLSSSASVELAFVMAWMSVGDWSLPPMELALLCQRAENEYVGVNCGIMDQAASACGEQDRLLLLDCRSLQYQTLPLPECVAIIVADTGVRHSLASSAYNDRRLSCERAVDILRRELPELAALRDVSPADFNRLSSLLPADVEMRARHVVEEIARTRRASPLLTAGDVEAFGGLMNACHASLRDLYEVSCPELDIMVRIAQSLPGCYGARLTGAGFGGCTVNLVNRQQSAAFVQALAQGYGSQTGRHAEIYVCKASAGASLLRA
jgi:galactokinase